MDLNFSVHDLFNIKIENAPKETGEFLNNEFRYFKRGSLDRVNLLVSFRNRINIPSDSVCLLQGLFYKNGILYFNISGSLAKFPIKDLAGATITLSCEKKLNKWRIFQAIESILFIKTLHQDVSMIHAAGCKLNDKALLFTAPPGLGKTRWVIERIQIGASFFGDEIVFVTRKGEMLCYPRGLNLHEQQGKSFKEFLKNSKEGKFIGDRLSMAILYFIKPFIGFNKRMKHKVENMIKQRSYFRFYIKDLLYDVKIEKISPIDEIIISYNQNSGERNNDRWSIKRVANFLAESIRYERYTHFIRYLNAFFSYGDEYAMDIKKFIFRSLKRQIRTIFKAIKKCEIDYSGIK